MNRREFVGGVAGSSLLGAGILASPVPSATVSVGQPRKEKDIILYRSKDFYCAFPSVVTRPNGELLVAFRRAPDRRIYGEDGNTHTDANSYLVMIRSRDNGRTWSEEPELLFAHPNGGSQDPCMVQLRDNSLLCSSYAWAPVHPEVAATHDKSLRSRGFVFMGGYLLKSEDGGHSWKGPIIPPHIPTDGSLDVFRRPTPALNRGAMVQGRDGRLYWAVVSFPRGGKDLSSLQLLISSNGGESWEYSCPVAEDKHASFNETSMYETPSGDLLAFVRTAGLDDHTVVVRSTDGGQSFAAWEDAGFQGHPHHALRLPDNRVFLIYGYRHPPFGIRARILNPECTDFRTAPEMVLRADGGSSDLGYPWATLMADGRILAVYYFNRDQGLRQIEGTILSLS